MVSSYSVWRGGRDFERGLCPLSIALPSPANNPLVCPIKQAGEGFTLKVLPEG